MLAGRLVFDEIERGWTNTRFSPRNFAYDIAGLIDPFGETFIEWYSTKIEEASKTGRDSRLLLRDAWLLSGLHLATWAPSVDAIPADDAGIVALLPSPPPIMQPSFLGLTGELIEIDALMDFAPRLRRLLERPA